MISFCGTPEVQVLKNDPEDCHRPKVTVWFGEGDDGMPVIVLTIGEKLGQQQRYVEMSYIDAAAFAATLASMVARFDQAMDAVRRDVS